MFRDSGAYGLAFGLRLHPKKSEGLGVQEDAGASLGIAAASLSRNCSYCCSLDMQAKDAC